MKKLKDLSIIQNTTISRDDFRRELINATVEGVDLKTEGYNSHDLELALDKYVEKTLLEYFPHTKLELDNKPFLQQLRYILDYIEWGREHTIVNVKVFLVGDKYEVIITLNYPGLLIGKAGHTIDKITKMMNEGFDKEVIITINECKLWHDIYK